MSSDKDKKKGNDFLQHLNNKSGKNLESFQEEKFIYQKKGYMKWVIQIAIIIIAAIVAYILLNQKIEVIDFTHMTYQDAASWAGDKDVIITLNDVYSSDVEPDKIVSQNIEPGSEVEKDTNIILDVSVGLDPYEKISLPDFDVSWSRSSIISWLNQNGIDSFNIVSISNNDIPEDYLISYRLIGAGKQDFNRSSEIEFTISSIDSVETLEMSNFLNSTLLQVEVWAAQNAVKYTYTYDYSSIFGENKIMYQSILSEDVFDLDDTVEFIVSLGERTEPLYMPNLLNGTIIDADTWAKNNNVNYTYSYSFSSIYNKDRIMSQNILANEEIAPEEKLHIIISKGEEITIPSFENVPKNEAPGYLQEEGIIVEKEEIYKSGTDEGDFISQSIPAGTRTEQGTEMKVTYSLGGRIIVPDYTNQPKVNFEEWVSGMNEMGANLRLTITQEESMTIAAGRIISQSIMNDYTDTSADIEIVISSGYIYIVPSFSDTALEDAAGLAQDNGLVLEIAWKYASGLEDGDFISQSIVEGTEIEQGTEVTVTYSLGYTLIVPKFEGQFMTEFEDWAEAANNSGANITISAYNDYSNNVEYGRIISQNIYNERVDMETEIMVIVSLGQSYQVINFTSWLKGDVETYCDQRGLICIFEEVEDSGITSGRVISQQPAANEIMSKKDFLIIQIAK